MQRHESESPPLRRRAVIEFDGSVSACLGSGPIGLALRGQALELLFSGVAQIAPRLPPVLQAVRVIELDADSSIAPSTNQPPPDGERVFRIEASEGAYLVRARGLQLHAEAGGAFFSVLPRTRVAALTRWGWWLLLTLLRVLPIERLTRGRRA